MDDIFGLLQMLSVVSAGAAAGMGGMDRLRGGGRAAARELAASRDRQVRLHSVQTDLALNLPPSIAMPDGEEHHHHQRGGAFSAAAASRLQIRDSEQESEIYQKCIRPPPNRTVTESTESPTPYRSSSAGVLATSSSSSGASSSEWSSSSSSGNAPLVMRCHSMSPSSKPGGATSTSHHHHHHHHHYASSQQQKTDFLQRTVKIFTGNKKTPQPPPPHLNNPQQTVASQCLNVPGASAQSRHQPIRRDGAPPV
ncbi:hypothetical protein ABEB36_001254 [Hypothenemus hampei]|uniref:Uncharacterized protein n=1 Tax=Hypothenemus hampei TaxID=57062 RepID=A0ABD1FE07_HYPHA